MKLFNRQQMGPINSHILWLCLCVGLYSCKPQQEGLSHLPPDMNRFTTTVLSAPGDLDEPMAFTFLDAEKMLIAERKGGVKAFDVTSQQMQKVAHIPVNTKYVNKKGESREAEEGLIGIIADPDYSKNHWIYMLYADPDEAKHVLARWEFKEDSLYQATQKIVLEYPAQREVCCHTGGGMVFDKAGNLYITTGNNTANPPSGLSNLDERPGHENADDQRTGGSTNDLRGKILRIHPEDDGTYTIPEGNLFPEGTANTRPEIYTMGHRNPWKVSIDHQTGYIYWGEVGPDAAEDTEGGPRGYDEFNQAKGPGFFGWPYFIADNKPYMDSAGQAFDVNQPVNNSPNNTGLKQLPSPQKAFIWYPYGHSEEFPLMGSAGRSATGGPVFRQADFPKSDKRFPAYFEGKWLIIEFMRGWMMSVAMDENGNYAGMEPFLPEENFSSAIDILFSPDGDLYVLEYGSAWFKGNDNAQIKRIQYNGGNRPPVVRASADKLAGGVPFEVQLSSDGTMDYDQDKLTYTWTVQSDNGFKETLTEPNPSLRLEKEGLYFVQLQVEDAQGKSDKRSFELVAGNAPPVVDIKISKGNESFFFPGSAIEYEILVEDQEDGDLQEGQISKEAVAINFDYVPEGFDPITIAQNHRSTDDWVSFSKGRALIDESDCLSCHRVKVKSIGPSYEEVAKKYKDDPSSQEQIAERIIKGSVGLWGEHAMSAHPDLSPQNAALMVSYIMSLNDPQTKGVGLPLAGSYTPVVPKGDNGKGGYLFRVAYTDKGKDQLPGLSSEKIIALRNPVLQPESFDDAQGYQMLSTPRKSFNIVEDNAFLGFHDLDLTGVNEILINAEASPRLGAAGGILELHLSSPAGELVGTPIKIEPLEIDVRAKVRELRAAWEKGGKKGPRPSFRTVRELYQPKFAISLAEIEGRKDIYLVFKNSEAKEGQILLSISEIAFKQTSSPQTKETL